MPGLVIVGIIGAPALITLFSVHRDKPRERMALIENMTRVPPRLPSFRSLGRPAQHLLNPAK